MNKASTTTTTLLTTSPAVRAYLRRATWGLPKERQQEVWDELEEHLLTRAEQFQLLGASPPEALARALAELGSPARVSAGMTQVYLMPKILIAAGAAALTLSAVLYAAAGGNEGPTLSLPVLTTRPVMPSCVRGTAPVNNNITIVSRKDGVTCYTFTDPKVYQGAYLSLSGIRKAVTAQGGTVGTLASGEMWLNLPNSKGMYKIKLPFSFSVKGEKYFYAAALVNSFYENQSGSTNIYEVSLQNYNRPVVIFDSLRLQFGNGTQPELGPAFYRGVAAVGLNNILFQSGQTGAMTYSVFAPSDSVNVKEHQIKTTLTSGEVVMLVTKRAGQDYDLAVAPVKADGSVTLDASQQHLHFVSDPAQLGPYPSSGRINALLVRVTNISLNNLKSGIFVPAQANSDGQ